jgi:hypothetical protein
VSWPFSSTGHRLENLSTDKIPDQEWLTNVGGAWFTDVMTQTMHYLAEARGALAQAAHGLSWSAAHGAHDLHSRDGFGDSPIPFGLDGLPESRGSHSSAVAALVSLTDPQLIESTMLIEEISRELDLLKARFAAEVAWRSRSELGNAGLAAMEGHVSPESLLRSLTRSSFQDAARRIRVGTVLADSEADAGLAAGVPADVDSSGFGGAGPFAAIVSGMLSGDLGVEGADRVIRVLAPVADSVAPDVLRQATSTLAMEGATCNVDELGAMARGVRDTLDRLGVADRERHLRAQRSLRKSAVIEGLRRVTLVLDPESDAILTGAIEAAMSPRLGGPRFVDSADQDRAAGLVDDPRTNEQMALDVLVDLVRVGVDRDDGAILGSSKPALRVTISLDDLTRAVDAFGHEHPDTDTGVAWLEGSTEPLSAATARRLLCDAGALPIVLGGGSELLDLGRTRRLFTAAQRVALANRDGGCRWPECDRPPAWCEAHHINPYSTGGKTDLSNGVLLCRRHHLLLHNNGWRIDQAPSPGELLLIPPGTVDPARQPRPMPTKLPRRLKPAG